MGLPPCEGWFGPIPAIPSGSGWLTGFAMEYSQDRLGSLHLSFTMDPQDKWGTKVTATNKTG
jgi:hypothetical protein